MKRFRALTKVLNGGLTDSEFYALEDYLLDNRKEFGFGYSYIAIAPILSSFGVNEYDVKHKIDSIVKLARAYYYNYDRLVEPYHKIYVELFMDICYVHAINSKMKAFEALADHIAELSDVEIRTIYSACMDGEYDMRNVEFGTRLEDVVYEEDEENK